MIVNLDKIIVSPEAQPRVQMSTEVVSRYADAMRNGEVFPPPVVFFDGTAYFLASGFHRVAAWRSIGLKTISCKVEQGGLQDAMLFAAGTNHDHGLLRTDQDTEKAILMVWGITKARGEKWTHERIGKHCHCSRQRVGQVLGNANASNSQSRAEKRAAIEKALSERPDAPANAIKKDLEAKGVKVDHKTVQAVREEKAKRKSDPAPKLDAPEEKPRRQPAEREEPAPAAAKAEDRLWRPEEFPTLNERDTMNALINALRVARKFPEKSWAMAVRIISHEVGVREYGYKERA